MFKSTLEKGNNRSYNALFLIECNVNVWIQATAEYLKNKFSCKAGSLWLERPVSAVPTQCKYFHLGGIQNKAIPNRLALKTLKKYFQMWRRNLKNKKNTIWSRATCKVLCYNLQRTFRNIKKTFLISLIQQGRKRAESFCLVSTRKILLSRSQPN